MVTVQTFLPYVDLLWVPVAALVAQGTNRIRAVFFVLACAVMLRLQIQMMNELGFPYGIFKIGDMPLYTRGVLVYSFFIMIFMILTYFSPRVDGYIYMGASISIFITAFCIASGVMVL
ncbi:MAG: hypothetical protein J0L77_00460 [Alphaproteobacteria bacterium]|nr:hypothetical protein [Alphaproteobacteria bacterium]